jgi:hypothetical protein
MPALAHFGLGFGFKRIVPKVPVIFLLIPCFLLDLICFITLIWPDPAIWISHGLFMSIVWSLLAGGFAFLGLYLYNKKMEKKGKTESKISIWYTSIVITLLVFSHWILDVIGWPMIIGEYMKVPLLFNDSKAIGFGVYSTWVGALVMDIGVFVVGAIFYILALIELKKKKEVNNHT